MPGLVQSKFAEVVTAKRKQMGLSQRQLGQLTGISNVTLSRMEKDPTLVPDIRTVKALSEALHLDYNYLLSLIDYIDDDPDMRIIARASKKMDPARRQQMMEMLRETFSEEFSKSYADDLDDGNDF